MSATATTAESRATAILIEAASRVCGKESQRAELVPGTIGPIDLRIEGTVGQHQVSLAYQVTLNIAPDELATFTTPWADILADVLERMPEAQRAAELARIRDGVFADSRPSKQTEDRIEEAAKAWRNSKKAENEAAPAPKMKAGAVKPTYSVTAATVSTPKATRQPAAAPAVAATAATTPTTVTGNGRRRKAG